MKSTSSICYVFYFFGLQGGKGKSKNDTWTEKELSGSLGKAGSTKPAVAKETADSKKAAPKPATSMKASLQVDQKAQRYNEVVSSSTPLKKCVSTYFQFCGPEYSSSTL